jgi:hypothetical protein
MGKFLGGFLLGTIAIAAIEVMGGPRELEQKARNWREDAFRTPKLAINMWKIDPLTGEDLPKSEVPNE